MIGGVLAIGLALYDGIVVVGYPALGSDRNWVARFLGQYAAFGGLIGGVTVVIVGSWLAAHSEMREDKSALRWYRPGKFAVVGFALLISLVAWLAVREHSLRKRLDALCAIQKVGGTVIEIEFRKNSAKGDSIELDMRRSDLSDAELDDIITLNPHRLLLGDTKVTDKGIMKLQQALPNCKIYR